MAALRSIRDGFLRKTHIGFVFFDALHRDYYGFSPQVCTLMARYPALRPLVLEAFVRPLVTMLRVIGQSALKSSSAGTLGEQFVRAHDGDQAIDARLAMLQLARDVLDGNDSELTAEQQQLGVLLTPATKSEHLRWAILEPIQVYESALGAYLNNRTVAQLDQQLSTAIDAWAGRMPLDNVWRSLTAAELDVELSLLDSMLLQTEDARLQFRIRLMVQHGRDTAVAHLRDEGEDSSDEQL